ncbi:MBL fold metallo-hydrolase [Methylophilus sp. UBA6697]|uniref:MBL fold metallo-hydrolase n=1 Tax=Methylophilus sp. UBA6697 TaxID=1946902 RepID=UPI0025DEC231|nr:MBL fold metallo-hydrolase [Methylophilus sp. UBA6697]
MRFTNIGGATAILEHKGKRILFDPWLDDGIFHGSWFHWPPTAATIEELGRFDYVYISHIHEDHCSIGTIQHINRDAEIIIMDRQPNFVAQFLRANDLNFSKVHLVPPQKGLRLTDDLFIDMIEADKANEMAYIIDSSLVICWDGFTIFNANDCQPHAEGVTYLKQHYPQIDLALLPYSGGSGYPSCYTNLTEQQKLAEKNRILNQRIAGFVANTRDINPKYVVPFADQYVVGGRRANLNRHISHGSCPAVVESLVREAGLESQLLLLNSGQTFDLETLKKLPDSPYQVFSEEDRDEYIADHLSEKTYDHERVKFSRSVPIDRLIKYARQRLWEIQGRRQAYPENKLVIDFDESRRRFLIHFQLENVEEVDFDSKISEPYLRISGSDTLLSMILIGHISWNIADAALFLDYERKPNVYDPSIYVLLNFLRL